MEVEESVWQERTNERMKERRKDVSGRNYMTRKKERMNE